MRVRVRGYQNILFLNPSRILQRWYKDTETLVNSETKMSAENRNRTEERQKKRKRKVSTFDKSRGRMERGRQESSRRGETGHRRGHFCC